MTPLVEVQDLKKHFPIHKGVFSRAAGFVHAVDGISYTVETGKTLGIVGESGSGKTVSSLTTLGLTRSRNSQIEGRIIFGGEDLVAMPDDQLRRIRGNDIAMIFQDPLSALHPFYKVGAQLVEAMQIHRALSRSAARAPCGSSPPLRRCHRRYDPSACGTMDRERRSPDRAR